MTSSISLPNTSPLRHKAFVYGVATSSFQIEGNADTRLESIWDKFCSTPGKISDGSNGQVACEHIKHWQQDLDMIASLGVDAYRFSISWPRVMHQDGSVNEAGMGFYSDLVDELNKRNIKAFVTLYHWDLPQHLEDLGGWLNRDTAYQFQQYADRVSRHLGDRVFAYSTLNEPFCSAYLGYEVGIHAPGLTGQANGRCAAHHLLLGHGLAMQVLRKNCPKSQHGIVLNFTPCYPLTESSDDIAATRLADEYINQWYMQPVMQGTYPAVIDTLDDSVKPPVQDGDMAIISQPLDYLGINFYTRLKYASDGQDWYREIPPENVATTAMGWEIYPRALTDLLTDLHQRYTLPPVYITENGAAMYDKLEQGQVQDTDRLQYYEQHLNAVHDAIEQGVNVKGYFAWSLMDNFEWAEGYEKRFGIVYVDYATQTRIIKQSGLAYRQLILSRD